jgi:hypothetical protein
MLYLVDPQAVAAGVDYYSALAHHLESVRPGTVARHRLYMAALHAHGVSTHLGLFKPKEIRYHSRTCDVVLRRHEEKETDVAMAAALVEAAGSGACDAIGLLSGDTDLLPALKAARRLKPGLKLIGLFPPYRANRAFRPVVDADFKISPSRLAEHLLPDTVIAADGRALTRPAEWRRSSGSQA